MDIRPGDLITFKCDLLDLVSRPMGTVPAGTHFLVVDPDLKQSNRHHDHLLTHKIIGWDPQNFSCPKPILLMGDREVVVPMPHHLIERIS